MNHNIRESATFNSDYDAMSDEKYSEQYHIGTIYNFEDTILYEERLTKENEFKLSKKKGVGGYIDIYVFGGEGSNPHFHLIGEKLNICICIYQNRYFLHGSHQDRLNQKQKNELDAFLRKPNKKMAGRFTNWEAICVLWNTGNDTYPFNPNNKQHDYTTMTESIG